MATTIPVPDPDAGIAVVRDGDRTIVAAEPSEIVEARGSDAFAVLDGLTPGWWAGVLAYDLGRAVERVVPRLADDLQLPDLLFARYAARLVIEDGSARLEGTAPARRRLEELLERTAPPALPPLLGPPRSSLDREAFESGVRAIVALVEAGQCYQVNLTRRLLWDRAVDLRALFHALGIANPAPHAALI